MSVVRGDENLVVKMYGGMSRVIDHFAIGITLMGGFTAVGGILPSKFHTLLVGFGIKSLFGVLAGSTLDDVTLNNPVAREGESFSGGTPAEYGHCGTAVNSGEFVVFIEVRGYPARKIECTYT
jgi:hypothetical protein